MKWDHTSKINYTRCKTNRKHSTDSYLYSSTREAPNSISEGSGLPIPTLEVSRPQLSQGAALTHLQKWTSLERCEHHFWLFYHIYRLWIEHSKRMQMFLVKNICKGQMTGHINYKRHLKTEGMVCNDQGKKRTVLIYV